MCDGDCKCNEAITAQDVIDVFRPGRPSLPKCETRTDLRVEALNAAVMACDFGAKPDEIVETARIFFSWLLTDMKE